MLAIFGTLKSKLTAIAGGVVAVLLGILYIFNKGRKSKATEVQAETAKTIIKLAKRKQEIENHTNSLSDDELTARLLKDARSPD